MSNPNINFKDAYGDVHADGADGNDYMLCGLAYEGETGSQPMTRTREKIDCCGCVGIIKYAKTIRADRISRKSVLPALRRLR